VGLKSFVVNKTLPIINKHALVQRFGSIQSMDIDSEKCQIAVSIKLKGEGLPLDAVVDYEFFANNIIIKKAVFDRPWIQPLADKYLTDRKLSHKVLENPLAQLIVKLIL